MARHDWEHLETWWEMDKPVSGVDKCRKCELVVVWNKDKGKPDKSGCPIKVGEKGAK